MSESEKIILKEEQKEALRHTLSTTGWTDIIEPIIRSSLKQAKAGIKQAADEKTLEEIGKKFLENNAVETHINKLFRRINEILGVREEV